MPSFIRASERRCVEFIMHPNAHCVRLPSGSELYFTFPIHLDTRQPMPPQDLEALAAYLERTQPPPVEGPGDPIYQNSLNVRSLISDWLQGSRYLDDMEVYAWESGHGFPIFDESGLPIDFQWVWDVIAFEGGEELVCRYVEYINDSAELHAQAHAEDDHDSLQIAHAPRRGDTPPSNSTVEQSQHQHAGRFRVGNKADGPVSVGGANFDNMDDCVAFLETLTEIEIKLLSKNVIQLEGDYSSSGLRIVRGPNAKYLPERRSQDKKEAVQAHMSPAETGSCNALVHDIDLRPVVLHHESAVKQGKKPVQEQKLVFKRVGSPPNQPVADEYYQASRKVPALQSREPLKKAYVREVEAALERARENLENAAHANRNKETAASVSKNKKTAAYEAEDQKLLDILAQSTKTAQQPASSFRPLFPPPVVNPSKKSTRIFVPKTARSIAPNPTRTALAAKPSTHRNLSFQEPTRLSRRPKATGRSSSYDNTSVEDPAYRVCGTSVHQAYAEDSPEDSPRPAPGGSWMDVFEELIS